MTGNWLVGLTVALNAGATVAYACGGRWNTAIYWLGATLLTGSVLWREVV